MRPPARASQWANLDPGAASLDAVYGQDPAIKAQRAALVRDVAASHEKRFGDGALRVFRCPARLNLRGMHVDTHGGYLNLMTHHREIVLAVRPAEDGCLVLANTETAFEEVQFALKDLPTDGLAAGWAQFIMQPRVRAAIEASRGHWSHYVRGAFLSVMHRFPDAPLRGLHGVIGSDIPRGASVSSSAALCICLLKAILALNGLDLPDSDLAQAARDAEWYTGSRCGLSDQAAMILGGVGEMVNIAIDPDRPDFSNARRVPFPKSLAVLVINSHTERSLSGAAAVDYTRNRFAYGMALEILRQEMARQGLPPNTIQKARRLATLSPVEFQEMDGPKYVLGLVRRVPREMTIDELRRRYDLPEFDTLYARYFASAPPELRPKTIALRGPLLFGIAESERARVFPDLLAKNDYPRAGLLMTAGHDGDRRVWKNTQPPDVADAVLENLIALGEPMETLPGIYGASTPVLDALVDAALDAGALGASLTGAGMAGTVLALCRAADAPGIAKAAREYLQTTAYLKAAKRNRPLTKNELDHAAVINYPTAATNELTPP